jgi:hypothetical protein
MKLKKLIRRFSVWLNVTTEKWVIPKEVWNCIEREDFKRAYVLICEAQEDWPNDPYIIYAESLTEFLSVNKEG